MTQAFIKDLEGLYAKYRKSGDWKSAASCAKQLISFNPDVPDYYRMAGKAFAWSGGGGAISDYYGKFLTKFHGCEMPDLVDAVRKSLPVDLRCIESSYEYLGGRNSFGAIIHRTQDGVVYYTKIQAQSDDAQRELVFYQQILKTHPDIRCIAPSFISVLNLDGLIYLTLSFVNGRRADKADLDEVIRSGMKITGINQGFSDHVGRKSVKYSLRPQTLGSVLPFFTCINLESANISLIQGLQKIAAAGTHVDDVLGVLDRISRIVLDRKAYLWLDVSRHFSILHGDYLSGNILIESRSGMVKIIDWSSLAYGLKSIDIALYLCRSGYDFTAIKKYALDAYPDFFDSSVNSLFFLYAIVAMNINLMSSSASRYFHNSKILADKILPATESLERHAACVL